MDKFRQFERFRSEKNQQFYFNLLDKEDDDSVIYCSEGYITKRNRNIGIASAIENRLRKNFKLKVAKDKRHYFIHKAKNGEPLGRSLLHEDIEDVKKLITVAIKNLRK